MNLAEGPLGKCFGGSDKNLQFSPGKLVCPTSATPLIKQQPVHAMAMKAVVRQAVYTTPLKTEKEILAFFDEEQIGVQCDPKCGDCKCGTCALGAKQMSIKDEKSYERFKSLMYLNKEGNKDDVGPFWVTGFPWNISPINLVDNQAAVEAIMKVTEKKLSKNLDWREIYELQLRTLVEKNFAVEISEKDIVNWRS